MESTLNSQAIPTDTPKKQAALIMPGGGARAAYQVGVLKAIAEQVKQVGNNPFPIICGTSAGAINAVSLASREENFRESCLWLENLWGNLHTDMVYRSDWAGITRNAWRLLVSLINSGIAVGRPVALLDNLPLKELLREKIDFSGISRNLKSGKLDAVCVTAMNYTEKVSVSFYQGGRNNSDWQRWRRQGIPTPLELRHLLASTAIPTLFPPQRVGRNYYGDGALRQLTPISPALHLGADKVLIVSTSGHRQNYEQPYRRIRSPALGQVMGHLLNSAFVDGLETDIELLERMNELLQHIPIELKNQEGKILKPIDVHVISPSQDIDAIAGQHLHTMPLSIRTMLRLFGANSTEGGINVSSFLLFSKAYCRELIELGYNDAKNQMNEILAFMEK
jgi:NTE family protein